jgi:hypothetical protein
LIDDHYVIRSANIKGSEAKRIAEEKIEEKVPSYDEVKRKARNWAI